MEKAIQDIGKGREIVYGMYLGSSVWTALRVGCMGVREQIKVLRADRRTMSNISPVGRGEHLKAFKQES